MPDRHGDREYGSDGDKATAVANAGPVEQIIELRGMNWVDVWMDILKVSALVKSEAYVHAAVKGCI